MTNPNNPFAPFAKLSKAAVTKSTPFCVIYTRVSTREQAEGNYSLETQRTHCKEYAERKGYEIEAFFGGTYESAKSDERKEFTRMLKFIRSHSRKISYIIVCYPDRFSRTGANAWFQM